MHLYFFISMAMNVLCYALASTNMPYDVVIPYVNIIRVRLKGTHFKNVYFSNSFKIEFMHVHLFITKLEVVEMTTMTDELSSRNPTEKSSMSHSCVSMSYSKDGVGNVIIYIGFPIWHWHFDLC